MPQVGQDVSGFSTQRIVYCARRPLLPGRPGVPLSPTSSAELSSERVGKATRAGLSWNLVGALVTNVLRLVTVVVLGRLLAPAEFGVVAAALSVTVVLHAIRDIGLGPALIQRKELDEGHIATAFAISVYVGAAIAVGLVLAAPWIGALYGIPESVDVLRALGAVFALRGVAMTSAMISQRRMNFRAVAIIDAVAYGAGALTSIGLAIAGAGAWALVGGYLLEEVISTIAYLCLQPPVVTWRIDRTRLRDLLDFGASQSVVQLAGIFATYGDNAVVGNVLGKQALGYYTRAYDLIKLPSAVFSTVVGSVLFPAFSRLQDDRSRLALGFQRIMFANGLVLFPASAVLIVAAPAFIEVLMGPGWGEAILPFRILAITMMFRTSYKVGAMVASAAGAVRQVALANVLSMVAVIGGAVVSVDHGLAGVAATTAGALTLVYIHCTILALRVSGLAWTGLVRAHIPGLVLGGIIAAPCWLVASHMAAERPWLVLLASVAIGGLLVLVGIAAAIRARVGDFDWLWSELRRVAGRRPSRAENKDGR